MKYIKEYLCDKRTPSDEEIRECLEIVSKEDCIIKLTWFERTPSDEEIRECLEIVSKEDCIIELTWFVRYNGWHNLLIKNGMTFEECKSKVPKFYGV